MFQRISLNCVFIFLFGLLISNCFSQPITQYTIIGGGSFCQGSTGNPIFLDGSDIGIDYELVLNDTQSLISGIYGTGDTISFGHYAGNGSYTIVAHDTAMNQTDTMNGEVIVTMILRPSVYNITGGGSICQGQTGPSISLANSQNSVLYDLLLNDTLLVSTYLGSGTGLFLGNFIQNGTYSVRARKPTLPNCPIMMNGSAMVTVYPLPSVFSLQGNGIFCSGTSGAILHIDSSQANVQYSVENTQGNIISNEIGTGDTLYFNPIPVNGTYQVKAIRTEVTGCSSYMSGTITVNQLNQTIYTVSGGGVFCEGSAGGTITLSGSQNGFEYYSYNPLVDPLPIPQVGNGGALVFDSLSVPGDYGIYSRYPQYPYCEVAMAGTVSLSYQALPTEFSLSGGGFYCEGQQGAEITLDGSETEVNYELILNGIIYTGIALEGTGAALVFNPVPLTGSYTVIAEINGCESIFSDSATVEITDCTGIDEENEPVPYRREGNHLYFTLTQTHISVFDLGGRLLIKSENTLELDFENLSVGIYMVQADKNLTLKIIRI